MKLVLQDEDGLVEHAQGIVSDDFAQHKLVERNKRIYVYFNFTYEAGQLVAFYRETSQPVVITEF